MIIIGAGMSGLLAGQYFRSHNPTILEKQDSLPNNHKALLRFRTDVVSTLTGIKFRKVKVSKAISFASCIYSDSNILMSNLYSQKVSGSVRSRSINDMRPCERYIAPDDFISKSAHGLNITYKANAVKIIKQRVKGIGTMPIISTMPVDTLAGMLDYDLKYTLKSKEIWSFGFDLDMDVNVYQTIYYPAPKDKMYRVSITGNRVIVEFIEDVSKILTHDSIYDQVLEILKDDFGIDYKGSAKLHYNHLKYGKLIECDDNTVKDFLGWATRKYNIYSLGRWGTHRQLLMDDVVRDLKVIDTMIQTNGYNR